MLSSRFLILLILLILFSPKVFAAAGVTMISVSMEQNLEAPRWMYDSKIKVKGGPLIALMVEAKKALQAKDRARCLAAVQKSYTLGKSLAPWLAWNQLMCAQLRDKQDEFSIAAVSAAVNRVDAQPKWMLYDPAAPQLKTAYVRAILLLAEQQTKSDRRSAWKTIDKLQQLRPWLNSEERSKIYRWAGDLAFVDQNLLSAQDFLLRSLNEHESADLRTRVDSIRTSLLLEREKKSEPPPPPPPKPPGELGLSENETELLTRMNRAYDAQDYVSSINDGVELLQKYPGSKPASEAADRVLDIYLSISSKSDDKFRNVRESIARTMEKVDSGRLSGWATNAYARGNYMDALNFAEKSYTKFAGNPEGSKMLLLAGKSAVACGEYKDANEYFERLIKYNGGTVEAVEATFRSGLIHFRNKKFTQAAAFFERVLALSGSRDFELRALYWQWRSHQMVDKDKGVGYAQALVAKFPLTYYGLRAAAELNGNQLQFKNTPTPVKVEYRLLDTERLAWERLMVLLKAGWFKEAEKELEALPEPHSIDERLIRAKLWAAAFRYDLAIFNFNKAVDENPLLHESALLKLVYPREFAVAIARESKALSLGEDWIRSLIRQESAFRPDARSTSNALGAMQLIPPTAQEMAKDLKVKDFTMPDSLLDPDINIHLGSAYLARVLRGFSGNMPLALAAYNAGPTRLRRWISARKDLAPLEKTQSSDPEVELWIDELPWEETSFYVKAILRNWLIYRLMDGSKVTLTQPIWLDAQAVPR